MCWPCHPYRCAALCLSSNPPGGPNSRRTSGLIRRAGSLVRVCLCVCVQRVLSWYSARSAKFAHLPTPSWRRMFARFNRPQSGGGARSPGISRAGAAELLSFVTSNGQSRCAAPVMSPTVPPPRLFCLLLAPFRVLLRVFAVL